jgi:hypothetical protein
MTLFLFNIDLTIILFSLRSLIGSRVNESQEMCLRIVLTAAKNLPYRQLEEINRLGEMRK